MISELTDDEVAVLYRHSEGERKTKWEKELRARARWAIIKDIPSRTGICAAGKPITIDDKSAYASGYVIHNKQGYTVCYHEPWTWNDRTAEEEAAIALLEALR